LSQLSSQPPFGAPEREEHFYNTPIEFSDSILFEKASKGFSEEARKLSLDFMKWSSHVHVLLRTSQFSFMNHTTHEMRQNNPIFILVACFDELPILHRFFVSKAYHRRSCIAQP
jgi:hypothetical protein